MNIEHMWRCMMSFDMAWLHANCKSHGWHIHTGLKIRDDMPIANHTDATYVRKGLKYQTWQMALKIRSRKNLYMQITNLTDKTHGFENQRPPGFALHPAVDEQLLLWEAPTNQPVSNKRLEQAHQLKSLENVLECFKREYKRQYLKDLKNDPNQGAPGI